MLLSGRDIKSPMPSGLRKAYPTGGKKQVTAEFKERIRAELTALGKDHRWLESQLVGQDGNQASRGSVSKLLGPKQSMSVWVDQICEVLDLAPPVAEVSDPEEHRLLEAYRRLPASQRKHLLGLLGLDAGVQGAKNEKD